jgi:hypothetical protein
MPDYEIKDIDTLYRRVPKYHPNYWKEINGEKFPSSFAFKTKPNEDGLSVDIVNLTTLEKTIGKTELFSVAEFSAAIPMGLGYKCSQDKKEDNDAHALIVGNTNPIAKTISKSLLNVFNK